MIRRSTRGRRPPSRRSFSSRSRPSVLSRELDSVLSEIAPQVQKTVEEVQEAKRLFRQPPKPKWAMEVTVQGSDKSPKSWPITQINTVEQVEKLFKTLISREQGSTYATVYNRVVGGERSGGSSVESVFAQWTKNANLDKLADKLGTNKDAMEYYLSADVQAKVAIADAAEKAKANLGDKKFNKEKQIVAIKKNVDELTKKSGVLLAKVQAAAKKAAEATDEKQQKSAADVKQDLEKQYKELVAKRDGAMGILGTLLDFDAGYLPSGVGSVYTGTDTTFTKADESGEDLTIDKNWSPYFSKNGYMCSPINNTQGFPGGKSCLLDMGESGTNFNLERLKELNQIAKAQNPGAKPNDTFQRDSDGYAYDDMPANWSWESGVAGSYRNVMQPQLELQGDKIVVTKHPKAGYVFSDTAVNSIPFRPRFFNSAEVALKLQNGATANTKLLCEPLEPSIKTKDGYACMIAKGETFNDPKLLNKDGKYEEIIGDEKPNIFDVDIGNGEKAQFVKMPPAWVPSNLDGLARGQTQANNNNSRLYFQPHVFGSAFEEEVSPIAEEMTQQDDDEATIANDISDSDESGSSGDEE